MQSENYQYHPHTSLPNVKLKEGHSGVIGEISFYSNGDYLRSTIDERGDHTFLHPFRNLFANRVKKRISLEECDDSDLGHIVFMVGWISNYKIKIPLEELRELRDLEKKLTDEVGEYRAQR